MANNIKLWDRYSISQVYCIKLNRAWVSNFLGFLLELSEYSDSQGYIAYTIMDLSSNSFFIWLIVLIVDTI